MGSEMCIRDSLKPPHHQAGSARAPHLEWHLSTVGCPRRYQEVWQRDDMVGMKMGQEYFRDVSRVDRDSCHPGRHATARVEQEPLRSSQHQSGDAESLGVDAGATTCTEEDDPNALLAA